MIPPRVMLALALAVLLGSAVGACEDESCAACVERCVPFKVASCRALAPIAPLGAVVECSCAVSR